MFALPDAVTTRGLAAWGDKTFDGRAVDVVRPSNVNDPWFSAFKSAACPNMNLLSRGRGKEVFKFKGADEGASVAPRTNATRGRASVETRTSSSAAVSIRTPFQC